MKNKILLGIVAAMAIMILSMISLASAAGAWSNNTFNNSLTSEALTFTGTGSFTRYLNVPSSVGAVLNSQMTLAGTHVHVPYIIDCYQETANNATAGDGTCGLNYSGSAGYWTSGDPWNSAASNVYDGNWGTYGDSRTGFGEEHAYVWVNYTKPVNASSMKLKMKLGDGPFSPYNITYNVPSSCFDYYTDKVQFVFEAASFPPPSSWVYGQGIYCRYSSGSFIQIDGSASTYGSNNDIYEEAVYWTISTDQYPTNVSVQVGSTQIFNQTGRFNYSTSTGNFWQTVNNYVQPCLNAYQGNGTLNATCQVPITFNNILFNGTVTYSSLLFNNYNWREVAQIYNNITYETKPETFRLNFTYDNQWYTSNNVTFYYDGTPYTPTITAQGDYYLASVGFDIPEIPNATEINTLYWKVDLTNSTGTVSFNSTFQNQTIYEMDFYHCNFTSPNKFITIRYKDETTDAYINASVTTSSWTFNILGSSLTRTLVYSSPGGNVTDSDSFCFNPSSLSIEVSEAEYQYGNAAAGYSTKTWPFRDLTLSNATTTTTLYLINLVDSGTSPVSFQAVNSQTSTVVEGVRVSAYRTINGIETLVNDGYTDASGLVSYYMSPITPYKIVAYGGTCASLTSTITPSGNLYNLLLSCGGGGAEEFTSQLDGVTYARTPSDGVNIPGTLLYSFDVNSAIYNLTRVRFEIIDATDETILYFNDSLTNTATCTPSSCYLTFTYTTYTGDNIKGKYYVAINGTTDDDLIMIEGDAYWRFIVINQNNSVNAIGRFMLNVQDFFNTWGTSTPNCLVYTTQGTCSADTSCKWVNYTEWYPKESENYQQQGQLCVARDDLNKTEFNRIVTIFFFMVVFLFILGRTTGYELNHPGAFVVMMSVVIWGLSIYGMFTFAGLTQYDFFNQYIFALSTSCVGLGYMISVIRRYSG